MNRSLTVLLIFLLTLGPYYPYTVAAVQVDNIKETSKIQNANIFEPTIASPKYIPVADTISDKESNYLKSQKSLDSAIQPDTELGEANKIEEKVNVIFNTTADYSFDTGNTSLQVTKNKGDVLTSEEVPIFSKEDSFEGWSSKGQVYSNEEVMMSQVDEDQTFRAVFKQNAQLTMSGESSFADQSIKTVIESANKTNVLVIPSPSGDGAAYHEYANSVAGIKKALFDMYQNGNGREFVLYVGSGATLSLPATMTSKTLPATVNENNVTFYSLQGKVSRLIFTGYADDPITSDTTLTTGSRTVALGSTIHFGSDVIIRNLNYTGTNMYMNGYSLFLNGGSRGNGLSVYGGSDSGDLIGNPTITVNTTGIGTWNFYGGNQSGGTLTGNPTILMNNTVSGISTISGGANIGTISGNTKVIINNLNGVLSTYYGGGVGTTANNTANVTGDVVTKIQAMNSSFRLGSYYGGVKNGNIDGVVDNTITGLGGWTSTGVNYIGGSASGNIGQMREKTAITNKVDTSLFSTGAANFIGANEISGTITGSIKNTIKAGDYNQGSFNRVDGGAGLNVNAANLQTVSDTVYDAMTPAGRRALAESNANFKVYGDISTKILEGCVSNGSGNTSFTRAAGFGGFIDGSTTVELGVVSASRSVGGQGFVYGSGGSSYKEGIPYSNSLNTRAHSAGGFDIVGGGGTNRAQATNIYIYGNTKTVLNNVVARWTYGGGFSGIIEGNTFNILNGGVVDTLEGAGYTGKRIFGNSNAEVTYGQVDYFLSGGGWGDAKIVGDVSVTVFDGIINASMGASYGYFSGHTITGNSDNRIYGGDFSGMPRNGPSAFSGGITNSGSLLGNANLTIDLRNYDGVFKLPSGTDISGGNPFNSTNNLGSDSTNTITLNIYTKPGSDVLNAATIWGDGARLAGNTKSGKIYMNIQAEGSRIGNLFTTYYSNVSSNQILRDVEMRIQGAKSINGISGGNASDNFTDGIIAASNNQVKISVGENVDGTGMYQNEPFSVTGLGIVNFTELNVTNGIKLMGDGGDIKNGRLAMASNHGTTYHQFGNIHLSKNAGIGISSATNLISGGKLIVEDDSSIESPPGVGKVNISDFETPDTSKDHLTWLKPTINDVSARVNSSGTWFGTANAYQVLTITPLTLNAKKVTPVNFSGLEKATGKTFIGDNDVTNTTNGFGIAIPGSIINYEVQSPGIANGAGAISHNVAGVKANNTPLTIQAWGTEKAGIQVQKGRLLIPYTFAKLPTLTFTPEIKNTGSWLYSGTIASSRVGSNPQLLGEQLTSNPVDWTSPDGEYGYNIKVSYSNKAEVSAKNLIITEQEAEKLTKEQALTYLEAKGRPFFTDTLTEDVVNQIKAPLDPGVVYRKHPITFNSGENASNHATTTVNLVVVRNESVLSPNRQFAVYAKDVRLTLPEANALVNEQDLALYTKATTIFADNRANVTPTVMPTAFTAIQQATEEELLKNVSTAYHYEDNNQQAEKKVNVSIAGELVLSSVPTSFDFGQQKISTTSKTYWPTITGNLSVKDTRGTERSPWRLTVKEQKALTNGSNQLENVFRFVKNGQEQIVNSNEVIVEEMELTTNGTYIVNQPWSEAKNEGLKLTVPIEKQKTGKFTGTLGWQLVSAPGNP